MWFFEGHNYDVSKIQNFSTPVGTQEGEIDFSTYNSAGWRRFVFVDESQAVDGFVNPPNFGNSVGELGGTVSDLQCPHDGHGLDDLKP